MKYKAILLIFFLAVSLTVSAVEPTADCYFEYVYNHGEKTAEITEHFDAHTGTPIPKDFVLPDYVMPPFNQVKYQIIGFYKNGVFRGCSKIESIAIPTHYKLIPSMTFIDCENLKKFSWKTGSSEGRCVDRYIEDGVLYSLYDHYESSYGIWQMFCYPAGKPESEFQVPAKCNSIGEYCFYKQRHLEDITLHDKLRRIEKYAFYGCEKLLSITVPAEVSVIGVSAFEGCSSLERALIPASVAMISERAFANCSNLKTLTIENGVETIGSEAFADCASLETIIIPSSVTKIDERAFAGCSNLKTVILQAGIRTFEADAFSGCNSLKDIRIVDLSGWCESDFATPLSNPAYLSKALNCMGDILVDLTIPATVTRIGQNAFYGYTPLKSITIHDKLLSISKDAFGECSGIDKICISDLAAWCNIEFASETSNPLLYGRTLSVNGVDIDVLKIPEGVGEIKQYAFVNGNFTQIWIPASVTTIADAAFKGIIPNSVRCYSETPPAVSSMAFSDYSATLFVPIGAKSYYWVHTVWGRFTEMKDIPVDAISISLDKSDYEMYVRDTLSLHVIFNPAETTDKDIIWSSSDESVATVQDGLVTALKSGNVIITATTNNNMTASCRLTIKDVFAKEIKINPTELRLHPGYSTKLAVTLLPENTTNQLLDYHSDNMSIATVSQDGIVEAISVGHTQITVSTTDGSNLSATCVVHVMPIMISSITLNASSVEGSEGDKIQITATAFPEDATNKVLMWSSSNESVATVDDTGLISLEKKGTAVITASATDDSGVSAECAVVVSELDGIVDIIADKSVYVRIFSLNGVLVYEGVYADAKLLPDYYIVVCDGRSTKVKVK